MKKFFSLVLALVMALSLTTVAWGAAATNDPTASESTVTLSDNLILDDGWLDVGAGEVVTLNLNGKTLSREDGAGNLVIYVHDGGKLTVNGPGTIDATNLTDGMAIYSAGNGSSANVITLNNVTVKSSYFGVYHNGNNYGADVTINNSTVIDASAAGAGVFLSGQATWANKNALTITNSNISGATAVEVKQSDATVTNSTLTSTYTGTASLSSNGNGMCAVGYALALTNNATDATAGTVTVNSGTFKGAVGIKDSATTNEVGNATGATIAVKGGTFTDDVSAYLASGVVLIGGAVKAQSTDKYDLHKADATGTLWAQNYTLTPVAAVKNADGTGTVAHYVDSYNVKVIEIPAAQAKVTDYYVTAPGSTVPVKYLREVAVVDYAYTVAAFTNLGTACGQVNNTLTPTADYYTVTVGTAKDTVYMEGTTGAYALAGNEIVQLNATPATKNAHTWVASGMTKGVVTSAVCAKCGAPAAVYTSISKIPAGSAYVTLTTALGANGEIYVVPAGAAVVPSTPSTDKVTSAETFDAGIAMYVGMSVLAATGSVVVLKKRED